MSSRLTPSGNLEEIQMSRRRSQRLASIAKEKAFESTGFHDCRRSQRFLDLAPRYAENGNESITSGSSTKKGENGKPQELLRAAAKSQIFRRSTRLASINVGAGKKLNERPKAIFELCTIKAPESVFQISKDLRSCRSAAPATVINKEVAVDAISKEKTVSDGCVATKNRQSHMEKTTKVRKVCAAESKTSALDAGKCFGSVEWTNEQEAALQKAYLMAKPSPHFWKKVSRMVPGKSAQECFEKIHSSIVTPLSSQPASSRARARRKNNLSPIPNFTLSGTQFVRSRKINKLAAHKTVRRLLRKHRLADQNNAADHFTLLESSPIDITAVHSFDIGCASTPDADERSAAAAAAAVRFRLLRSPARPSPEVLKKIKNMGLHDKYIDQLHYREARRVMLSKKASNVDGNCDGNKIERCALKAAKIALFCDAESFIKHFQHAQANPSFHDLDTRDVDEDYDDDDHAEKDDYVSDIEE